MHCHHPTAIQPKNCTHGNRKGRAFLPSTMRRLAVKRRTSCSSTYDSRRGTAGGEPSPIWADSYQRWRDRHVSNYTHIPAVLTARDVSWLLIYPHQRQLLEVSLRTDHTAHA